MAYISFVFLVLGISSIIVFANSKYKTRYRVKELPNGKFVPQFFCFGIAADLGIKAELWGWYPMRETEKETTSFLVKKEFEGIAEVADPYIAWETIKKFKARCSELKESEKKLKPKSKYHYK